LLLCVLADVIAIALLLMARLAEVSVAPTEPLRNTATELAFKLYKILAVLWTIFDWYFATAGTDKLLRVEGTACVLRLIHRSDTVLSSSEVGLFALEAHEICVDDISVLLGLAEVRRALVFKLLV
jgi:hypothetical protein